MAATGSPTGSTIPGVGLGNTPLPGRLNLPPVTGIYGTISAAGTILRAGSGQWTVTREDVSIYTIRFAFAFNAVPGVSFTPLFTPAIPAIFAQDLTSVTVQFFDFNGDPVDTQFTFFCNRP